MDSVGKEERHLADSLLAILRSLDTATRKDNKQLRDLCKAKLKELNASPNAGATDEVAVAKPNVGANRKVSDKSEVHWSANCVVKTTTILIGRRM